MMLRPPTLFLALGTIALTLFPLAIGQAITPTQTQVQPSRQPAQVQLAQRSRVRRIQFKPGQSSAILEDAVVLGTRDVYVLGARRGQRMTIQVSSLEDNVVFDLVTPPTPSGSGRRLRQEAKTWSGTLPQTGDYRIVVGTTRGNGSYNLQVSIR